VRSRRHAFTDGTVVQHRPGMCVTRLPCGAIVRARTNRDSTASAGALGYGKDVASMTRDHDYLHARLCDHLGVASHSLRQAAGLEHDGGLAALEEAAVCAFTRWISRSLFRLRHQKRKPAVETETALARSVMAVHHPSARKLRTSAARPYCTNRRKGVV
jgi:hypothetical protein